MTGNYSRRSAVSRAPLAAFCRFVGAVNSQSMRKSPSSGSAAKGSPASPSQSARKALGLLKLVGLHHAAGLRLTDLIELTGQDKSTIHRLLGTLVDEGFVERVASSKRYRLGVEAIQLGFLAADMSPLTERFRAVLQKLARITEDTVFLVVRSGNEVVYIHREEGSYPVKAFIAAAGMRRPMGLSAVGVAMLAQEPDAALAAVHARHAQAYEDAGVDLATLRELVHAARKQGYSEMRDIGPLGTAGVGCAFAMSATARAGVSIAAVRARMGTRRMRELGQLLRHELAPYAMESL